jgi:hypothetical protein
MIKNLISLPIVTLGYFYYLIFKKTPNFVHQSLVKSYCFTNGLIIIFLNFFCKIENINFFFLKKIFVGNAENKEIQKTVFKNVNFEVINKCLKNNGYYIFSEKISEVLINKILEFSKDNICYYYDDEGKKKFEYFDQDISKEFKSAKYSYNVSDIYNSFIKDLIFDATLIQISKNYFNAVPYLSNLAMWWSPVRKKTVDIKNEIANQSAQFFHFDLDKIKWLKVFFYITDTDIFNGPHEYVEGSHKIFAKPKELRDIGYHRLPDSLIRKYFHKEKIKKILGLKGTVFVADTSCYHRGSPPLKNHRLLLQIEYSNSLFGGNKIKILGKASDKKINQNLKTKNIVI